MALALQSTSNGVQSSSSSAGMDRTIARKPLWQRYWLLALIVLSTIGIAAAWLLNGPKGSVFRVPANELTIATVTEGPFEDYIAVRGRVAPFLIAHLTTDQGGTVKQVLVEDGATVKKGEPLIVLSNPALQLQVASQQLQFEQTRFKYQQDLLDIEHHISELRNALARDKILLDGKAIAPNIYKQEQEDYNYYVQLRGATIASRDAEQRVLAAPLIGQSRDRKTGVDISNAAVEALTIRAPMDGQLTNLDAEVGQSKSQGAVLGQVNSADHFKLTADVDQYYLGRVANGQETLFSIDSRNYRAKVAKVYPQVTGGTFKVDFYFDGDAPASIHVGQEFDLKLQLGGASQAVMLPNGPFYQDTGGSWVFVVTPDGKSAIRRKIRLGRRNPDDVEVLEGLKPGEKVIVSGYENFLKIDRLEIESSNNSSNP
ncbi:MAG: HlyD family efflux transporter periplasmic adaptor subunit [Steroidobacter sp.]